MAVRSLSPLAGGAHGWPFAATVADLAACGYAEHEYLVEGDATHYRLVHAGDYAFDGRWEAEAAGTRPYRTRVLVRVPTDQSRFSGTILVGWNNVSAGFEGVTELLPELVAGGHAQVCASVQRAGVHGFPFPDPKGLVQWDPERYGTLSIEDDDLSYGIFTDVAAAAGQLTGLDGARLVAIGGSQSGKRLASYLNGVQPLSGAFDGFIIEVYSGQGTLLDASDKSVPRHDYGGPMNEIIRGLVGPHQLRDDLGVPVVVLNSETETRTYAPGRQPDTDTFRFWEVAGAAHASSDRWEQAAARSLRDFGDQAASPFVPGEDRNTVSLDPVRDAVLHHMHRWVHGGPPPPVQPRIEVEGEPPRIVRDENGNALGGIRLPDLEVPTASHSGERTHAADMFGRSTPFPPEKLRALYPDDATYQARYGAAVDAALAAGVILPRDAERLRERSRAAGCGSTTSPRSAP